MGLVFWVTIVGDSLRTNILEAYLVFPFVDFF
jgi:hypothetical protein